MHVQTRAQIHPKMNGVVKNYKVPIITCVRESLSAVKPIKRVPIPGSRKTFKITAITPTHVSNSGSVKIKVVIF